MFPRVGAVIEESGDSLAELDIDLTKLVAEMLGIEVQWMRSSDMGISQDLERNHRLLEIVRAAGATEYRSGPAAREYLDVPLFEDAGVGIVWQSYEGYPEYEQVSEPFEHQVSILDLLFMAGPRAPDHIWGALRQR